MRMLLSFTSMQTLRLMDAPAFCMSVLDRSHYLNGPIWELFRDISFL